jgi:hypothetical protein
MTTRPAVPGSGERFLPKAGWHFFITPATLAGGIVAWRNDGLHPSPMGDDLLEAASAISQSIHSLG